MIQIIKDGQKKKYIHKCRKCKTVFSYTYFDTYEEVEQNKEDVSIKNDTSQNFNMHTEICSGFNNIDSSFCNTHNIDPYYERRLRSLEFEIERISCVCRDLGLYRIKFQKNKKERYCICPSCAEENEVEFTEKTLISLIRMVKD